MSNQLSRRRSLQRSFQGAACAKSSRFTRGAIGGAVGLVGGYLLGLLGAVAFFPTRREEITLGRAKALIFIRIGAVTVGGAAGAYLGARQPEC
jgi:hypothetical protein